MLAKDCLWSVVDGNSIQINIQKAQPDFWMCALDGDSCLNLETARDYRKVAEDLKQMGGTQTAVQEDSRSCSVDVMNLKDIGHRELFGSEPSLQIEIVLSGSAPSNAIALNHDSVALFVEGRDGDLSRDYYDSAWVEEEFYGGSLVKASLSLPTDDTHRNSGFFVVYLNADAQEIGRSTLFFVSKPIQPNKASTRLEMDLPTRFIPADKFEGAKPCFVFRKGCQGLGYYTDIWKASTTPNNDFSSDPIKTLATFPKGAATFSPEQRSRKDPIKPLAIAPEYLLEKQTNIGCYQLIIKLPFQKSYPNWKPTPSLQLTHAKLRVGFDGPVGEKGEHSSYELSIDFVVPVVPEKSTMDLQEDHIAFRLPIVEEEKVILALCTFRNTSTTTCYFSLNVAFTWSHTYVLYASLLCCRLC